MPRQVGLRDGVPVRTGGGGTAGAAIKPVCRLLPGKKCQHCDAIGARDRIEAQNGLNDTYEGDPYPHCMGPAGGADGARHTQNPRHAAESGRGYPGESHAAGSLRRAGQGEAVVQTPPCPPATMAERPLIRKSYPDEPWDGTGWPGPEMWWP
jgi:hypothetical protein